MLIVVGQTYFLSIWLSFFCIVSLNMTPSVFNFDSNGPLVCHSVWKIEMIKIWYNVSEYKINMCIVVDPKCCFSIRSSNSCIASRNTRPSLRGFRRDGRYIHQYYVPSTPCFHMNWGEHLLMLYLYWIGNLLVINSNCDHTATSSISYLGCKSILIIFFKIVHV